jgi:hypothetical protein
VEEHHFISTKLLVMSMAEDSNLLMRTEFEEYIQALISAQVLLCFKH